MSEKATYTNAQKLRWYDDILCPACGERTNSWEKRISRALGYQSIVCESCIAEEYGLTVPELRDTMENHFGLVPCPGL